VAKIGALRANILLHRSSLTFFLLEKLSHALARVLTNKQTRTKRRAHTIRSLASLFGFVYIYCYRSFVVVQQRQKWVSSSPDDVAFLRSPTAVVLLFFFFFFLF